MNGRFGTSSSNNVFPPPEYLQQSRSTFNSSTPVPSLSALSRLATQSRGQPLHASPIIQQNGVYPFESTAKQSQTVLNSMNMPQEQPVFDINDFPALGGGRAPETSRLFLFIFNSIP